MHAGRAEVALSWDGAYCSVVWPEECQYTVYATEPLASKAPRRELARGSATALAWASASPTFAILHVPKVTCCASPPVRCDVAACSTIIPRHLCGDVLAGIEKRSTLTLSFSAAPYYALCWLKCNG